MDPKKSFKAFRDELCNSFPETTFAQYKDTDPTEFEDLVTPHVIAIVKRDTSMFDQPFVFFDVDLSPLFSAKPDLFWKNFQKCAIAPVLSGNIKDKIEKIAEAVKSVWGGAGHSTDEIDKILGTEESRNKISEIMEFVMTTRLAKIVINLAESIDISELGIDFDDPEAMMKSFQTGEENPAIEKIGKKIKNILEEKVRRGEFTKEMLAADLHTINLKIQTAFGDMFNDMLGGRKAEVPAKVILGNSPEARRARMVARLQRKLAERKDMD